MGVQIFFFFFLSKIWTEIWKHGVVLWFHKNLELSLQVISGQQECRRPSVPLDCVVYRSLFMNSECPWALTRHSSALVSFNILQAGVTLLVHSPWWSLHYIWTENNVTIVKDTIGTYCGTAETSISYIAFTFFSQTCVIKHTLCKFANVLYIACEQLCLQCLFIASNIQCNC